VALLCTAFFVNDLAIPVIWAASTDIGGRYAGTVAGVMNMAGGVGAVISPALTPVLRSHFDWPVIFAVLAGGWFIAALAWLRIDASTPLVPEPKAEDPANRMAEGWEQASATAAPKQDGLENQEQIRE
jgi:MFS family permease